MVVAWCKQHGNPSIVLTDYERNDRFERTCRAKNQMAVFQLALCDARLPNVGSQLKLRETAYMIGI